MQDNSILEAVSVPGVISGTAIVADLCARIAEKLAADCNLRASDAYAGYAFRARVEIQLTDVYPCEVVAEVAAGRIDAQKPSQYLDLGAEMAAEPESGNLERPIDPAGFVEPEPRIIPRPLKVRRDFLS